MTLLESTVQKIGKQSPDFREKAVKRIEQLTMPHWALGRLLDLSVDLAGITGSMNPPHKRKTVVVMAGDHGVTEEGVSKYPSEVTAQMVYNFVQGGAAINVLSSCAGAEVKIVDMGVKTDLSGLAKAGKIISSKIGAGTSNIAKGPAMTPGLARQAVEAGIQVALDLSNSTDIFATGDMGIGNTTPSAAIIACVCRAPVKDIAGHGTGIDDAQYIRKVSVLENILKVNSPDPKDGLDILSKVGGFEIGGLAGLILGAASMRKPVMIDGFISTAGALIASLLCPSSVEFMIASHNSQEKGHKAALKFLNKMPLLDLNLRLGEGTGAALCFHLLDSAAAILTQMATFEEAAVSKDK